MTCDDARELFSALIDEALGAPERARLETHLGDCAACRAELERFRRTVALVGSAGPVRAPVGFVDRVLAAARPAPWHRRLTRRLFLPVRVKVPLEAAALVLVAAGAVYLFQQSPEIRQAGRLDAPPLATAPGRDAPEPAPGKPRTDFAPRPEAAREGRGEATDAVEQGRSAPAAAPPTQAPGGGRVASRALGAKTEELGDPRLRKEREAKLDAPAESALARAPDIAGRLSVRSLAQAERALASTLERLGGTLTARREAPGGRLLEIRLPAAGWNDLRGELERLGRLALEREPGPLPATLTISLRLAE